MAWSRIEDVLRSELGASTRELFDTIDERPCAAARSARSIARCTWCARGGKIQYPGIEDAIRLGSEDGERDRADVVDRVAARRWRVAAELRDRLLGGVRLPARGTSQALFASLLAAVPGRHVPAVMTARSSRRVLTTAFADRPRARPGARGGRGSRPGLVIFRACFELMFRAASTTRIPPGELPRRRLG